MKLSRSIVLFPALALVVTVGCVSSSDAQPDLVSKKTTTTIAGKKKKTVPTTLTVVKGGAEGSASVLALLQTIPVMNENGAGYSRSLFKHWIDADGDSCNTREEVLIAESTSRAQVDAFGCKVIEGDWYSPYEGQRFTSPSDLDIDHVVALKEAWDSGAWAWTSSRRQAFANDLSDPRSLIAVSASQNRSKGDRDPSNWIPPQTSYLCTYLSDWISIKARWNLAMDQSEAGRIRNLLNRSCSATTVAPRADVGSTPTESSPTLQPTIETPTTQPSGISSPSGSTNAPTGQEVNGGKRCKEAEFGQTGTYRGIPYICSNTRQDGSAYKPGYYMWRPQ